MRTLVLPTHTPALFNEAVARAVELLRVGQLVALPTETVYGLAANAFDAEAVARVFEVKGRPAHNPVIVHVASLAMARRCVSNWPDAAATLAAAFWPGPLTLVLPRSSEIPDIVTAGGATVGIRWPSHPLIQEVIRLCDFPLAAPSANPASQLSPTEAEHVRMGLGGKIPLIVDGGRCHVGIESTVLDLSQSPPRVLRPGMIHVPSLRAVVGDMAILPPHPGPLPVEGRGRQPRAVESGEPLRSPGQLPKHYAPKARLVILGWRDEADLKSQISNLKSQISTNRSDSLKPQTTRIHVIAHTCIPSGEGFARVSVIPHDPEAFARAIYAELHACDEQGADLIVVEALPPEPAWQAIIDRLRRAAVH